MIPCLLHQRLGFRKSTIRAKTLLKSLLPCKVFALLFVQRLPFFLQGSSRVYIPTQSPRAFSILLLIFFILYIYIYLCWPPISDSSASWIGLGESQIDLHPILDANIHMYVCTFLRSFTNCSFSLSSNGRYIFSTHISLVFIRFQYVTCLKQNTIFASGTILYSKLIFLKLSFSAVAKFVTSRILEF